MKENEMGRGGGQRGRESKQWSSWLERERERERTGKLRFTRLAERELGNFALQGLHRERERERESSGFRARDRDRDREQLS